MHAMTDPSWLKQVHAEEEKIPGWLSQIFEHVQFSALHREGESWLIFTMEDHHIDAPTLREVCQKFTTHYSR